MMAMSRTLNGMLTLYIGDANAGPEIPALPVTGFPANTGRDRRLALNDGPTS